MTYGEQIKRLQAAALDMQLRQLYSTGIGVSRLSLYSGYETFNTADVLKSQKDYVAMLEGIEKCREGL